MLDLVICYIIHPWKTQLILCPLVLWQSCHSLWPLPSCQLFQFLFLSRLLLCPFSHLTKSPCYRHPQDWVTMHQSLFLPWGQSPSGPVPNTNAFISTPPTTSQGADKEKPLCVWWKVLVNTYVPTAGVRTFSAWQCMKSPEKNLVPRRQSLPSDMI